MGVSSETELAYSPRVGLLPSSEAEIARPTGGIGGEASSEAEIVLQVRGEPRMGRTVVLGHGPSTDWASLGPGEDSGAVGELEEFHGIRV